jgi:hypothetical protein
MVIFASLIAVFRMGVAVGKAGVFKADRRLTARRPGRDLLGE